MASIRALTTSATIHYLRLLRSSSFYARPVSMHTDGHNFVGTTTAGDGSALKAGPAAGPRNGGDSVHVLVDSCASGHRRRDHPQNTGKTEELPGVRCATKNSTAGVEELDVVQGLLRGKVIDNQRVRRLLQLL